LPEPKASVGHWVRGVRGQTHTRKTGKRTTTQREGRGRKKRLLQDSHDRPENIAEKQDPLDSTRIKRANKKKGPHNKKGTKQTPPRPRLKFIFITLSLVEALQYKLPSPTSRGEKKRQNA